MFSKEVSIQHLTAGSQSLIIEETLYITGVLSVIAGVRALCGETVDTDLMGICDGIFDLHAVNEWLTSLAAGYFSVMCLLVFSWKEHPEYPFIFAGNRDEFYKRPTDPAAYWQDYPDVLAGRDLEAGGTWLGLAKNGRFAALTNYRNPQEKLKKNAKSRGHLVGDFLTGTTGPGAYLEQILAGVDDYNGFNLVVGDGSSLHFLASEHKAVEELQPGLYGLSNAVLNTPWFKVERAKESFCNVVGKDFTADDLLDVFYDDTPAPKGAVQVTGLPKTLEKMLSPMFIKSPAYGTRASTVVLVTAGGRVEFVERQYEKGHPAETGRFELTLP